MKLVKFVCVAKAHAGGRSESTLTIHEGAWAFCPSGGDRTAHEWRPSDGVPLTAAMRFTPRQQPSAPATSAPGSPKAPSKGKLRTR